ncbi:zincin-like metallopeptidase domain-containing protein [Glycocaulis sp.]|uniref:ArdC family protein n=1 Tax=Glycocaulis sp. TaxID=1969725 RepID=UPI0025BFEC5C|nr:zincin-like metallopeptidase domain-containing protein [Glycocaulis sp.]MCH8522907.1 ssDNA-binding domain-containing protein [Glycocaulis sp.]
MARPSRKSASTRPDIHTQITNQIIEAIEQGAGDWQMPWHRTGEGLNRPLNADTGNAYRGINVLSLWVAAEVRGFSTGLWGTYRQWQAKGAQVRKGEKASLVIFYKEYDAEDIDTETGETTDGKRRFARASYVFNADQVDGYERPEPPEAINPVEAIAQADAFIRTTGAKISHGGDRAYYRPSSDSIQMPEPSRFLGTPTSSATECYYSTLLHELTHWTGHAKRCDRQFGERFGDEAYAMEELVAELGAAFLCADLGIALTPRPDHAAYIDHWLKVLKADNRAIFTAAAQAAKAGEFLEKLQSASKAA